MIGLLEIIALSTASLALVGWFGAIAFVPKWSCQPIPYRIRAIRARLWLYAPFWVPLLVVGASILPGWIGAFFGLDDHCVVHNVHHHHLCVLHPPHSSSHPLILGGVALVFSPLLWSAIRSLFLLRQERRLTRALVASCSPSSLGSDICILEQHEPVAFTVGVFQPVILLSTGLVRSVSEKTLGIVLAHERAHIQRRDMLWAHVDSVVAFLFPREIRFKILHELVLAREQACDLAAARHNGSVHVAAALTEVARLGLSQPAFGMSVGGSSLKARVVCLLQEPVLPRWWFVKPTLYTLALVALGAGPIHNLIEYAIAFLLH